MMLDESCRLIAVPGIHDDAVDPAHCEAQEAESASNVA